MRRRTHMNKDYIYSYISYIIAAFCVSIAIKANVGISSFNAMNASIAYISNIKIGTITIAFNTLFLLLYARSTHFKFIPKYIIQFISVMCFGFFINLFTYKVLGSFHVEAYPIRILMIIISTIFGASAIGVIVSYAKITFPIESLCESLSHLTPLSFKQLRYGIDIIAVVTSTSITFLFDIPLFVREGTIISLLLFSYVLNHSKTFVDKIKPAN